ncbi:MAG: RecQ family ATP-dependent DNA helicase [Pontiellaceae bacterium]|nr:RecQ family ATP-dependent DNA helicase [Pontiellaceae bacterium]MBN2783335.1 RecQ family ATP-dependent DNA helicase [Pontiellaceae bacterium]
MSSRSPASLLKSSFGFDAFRPGQEETIEILRAGRSAAAIFPTGSGKSLCYQLTALLLPGLTLIVSPLLALMKDQIDALQARNIAAERLDSSLTEEKYREVSNAIRAGALKMLFVSPERLTNERFLNLIRGQQISLLAVDEAHCISAWGHNFRPDYLKLAQAVKSLQVERVLALTATATPKVTDDMAAAFNILPTDIINTGYYRPNLAFRVTACNAPDRDALLLRRLKERPAGATIVYVHLQKDAEEKARLLCENGFNAAPYHAGLKTEIRTATQDAFMSGGISIICATIAFGMGVDKSDIRYIYHYHLAKGYESYLQETGRAGRDGEPAVCELFACSEDCTTLENFIFGDTPDETAIDALINEILDADEIDITARELSQTHDIRPLVVSTLLTHLELFGIIQFDGYYYSEIRFTALRSSAEILAGYSDKQGIFLKKLFSACTKARKWITLDIETAIDKTGQPRDVILRALESLQENGAITLQMSGYRQRFKLLKPDSDRNELRKKLALLFLRHEQMEIDRIHAMIDYAQQSTCLTKRLLVYFGETIEPCGHCGICLGDAPATLPERRSSTINPEAIEAINRLAQRYPAALGRPRQQARFLCGLNSPAVTAERALRGNPHFGSCSSIPFQSLLDALTE